MKIIPLDLSYLDDCIELDKLTLNGIWSKKQWEVELTNKKNICLGIVNKAGLQAITSGWQITDEFHLNILAVHPSSRRKGLATSVLQELLNKASKNGSIKATLEVSNKNFQAIGLYKKLGFKVVGIRKNYYKDKSDAIIQWISLNQC